MQSGLTTSLEKIRQAGQGKIPKMWSHQGAASAEHYLMVDKGPPSFSSIEVMRHVSRFILLAAGGSLLLLTGCETGRVAGGGPYHVTAYRPHDPSAVRVRVSLSKQNIYV